MSARPDEAPTGPGADQRPGADVHWQRAWDAVLSDDERKAELAEKVDRLIALETEAALGPPTVVMGIPKSGTSALAAALRDAGVPRVFQIHSLLPRALHETERDYRARNPSKRPHHVWDAEYLANRLPTAEAPWRLVVSVREPIGQAVAAFFQTAERRDELSGATVEGLLARFDHSFSANTVRWCDLQLRDVLGLDLYDEPFDPVAGSALVERDDMRVLVLRRESLGGAPDALGRFLGRGAPVDLPRANVGADKDYAELYAAFLAAVRPSEDVLDRAYGSRMVRHFYSDEEIAGFRARWSAPGA